ncbi:MAG: dephospho-CoA kinase [Eubacteriales bacterium]|nr:dephospho-CoA kinase [Eubacteriales bacterium]
MTVNKIIFGITGGSGVGKSYISDLFRQRGIDVIDCDKTARQVVMPDGRAYDELYAHFGKEYFAGDGILLRRKLAEKVFSDEKELGILNEITHKHIKRQLEEDLISASQIAAIDGAVIIGSPVEDMCSFLVGVVAERDTRIKRIMSRDSISEESAIRRIDSQPDADFYRQHCRYIIENDGKTDLVYEVENIMKDIEEMF